MEPTQKKCRGTSSLGLRSHNSFFAMSSPPIMCVSYNSCIDRILEADDLHIGGKNKVKYVIEQAAGKAVNIAYILSTLRLPCTFYGFIGNDCIKLFEKRLVRVSKSLTVLPVRTRVNITLIDNKMKTGFFLSFFYRDCILF